MVPIIIDTGASIIITPYMTDFIGPLQSIQELEVKGIALGLQVCGMGTVKYSFLSDDGTEVTLQLKNCLYVPQCTSCLLCPRQISHNTGNSTDCFISGGSQSMLICHGKHITISYGTRSNLPIIYSTPGICTYTRFCAHQSVINSTPAVPTTALSPGQQKKLQLHEWCAHPNWDQLNAWILQGLLPCDTNLTNEPDPVCSTCQFGKAHRKTHKCDVGHIGRDHQQPGNGVSSDGMEAGCPGQPMTMSGLPTNKCFHNCSFWVDHYSQYVYVTFQEIKRAKELVRFKLEFKDFASCYQVKIKTFAPTMGCTPQSCSKNLVPAVSNT
jgi:hypothetical protein